MMYVYKKATQRGKKEKKILALMSHIAPEIVADRER